MTLPSEGQICRINCLICKAMLLEYRQEGSVIGELSISMCTKCSNSERVKEYFLNDKWGTE